LITAAALQKNSSIPPSPSKVLIKKPPPNLKKSSTKPFFLQRAATSQKMPIGAFSLMKSWDCQFPIIVSTEASGTDAFTFLHGTKFGPALKKLHADFAKALVRYEVGNEKVNKGQRAKLKKLSDYCIDQNLPFMLEILVSGKGDKTKQICQAIEEFHAAGVWPTVWKLEGLARSSGWKKVQEIAQVPLIILGRGESNATVKGWIKLAAESGHVHGFAVGRTVFLEPLKKFQNKKADRKATVAAIAKNFLEYVKLWERATK
jgi:myo-inositol catabolism protein IolC